MGATIRFIYEALVDNELVFGGLNNKKEVYKQFVDAQNNKQHIDSSAVFWKALHKLIPDLKACDRTVGGTRNYMVFFPLPQVVAHDINMRCQQEMLDVEYYKTVIPHIYYDFETDDKKENQANPNPHSC